MSKCHFIHNFFQDGYLDTLVEVRLLQQKGQWTQEERAEWLKQVIIIREELIHHRHSTYPNARAYYAGRIAALKSRITAPYAIRPASPGKNPALPSHVEAHRQERLREATVYTHASGWDWEQDEEDELDLIEQERMLTPSTSKTWFKPEFVDIWLAVCITWFSLVQGVTVWQAILILIFSGKFAYDIEDWWIGSKESSND